MIIAWITIHLLTPEGWKAELAWLADPQRTVNSNSGTEYRTETCA